MGGTLTWWKIDSLSVEKNNLVPNDINMLEAQIDTLEEKFKKLAPTGQILDLPVSSKPHASSSTPDFYVFGASSEVIDWATVIRV